MSDVKRYSMRRMGMNLLPDGDYVLHSDYAALEARLVEVEKDRDEWRDLSASYQTQKSDAKARLAEVEAALKLNQDLDAINVAEVARLTTEMQKQSTLMDMGFAEYERRLATAQHALVVWDVAHRTGRNEPLVRAFEVGVEALTAIRALAQEEPTT